MSNPSVVIAKKRNQIYWKSPTNIYLCFLVIMYTPYFFQLLWHHFSMWRSLKTLDETILGWFSDKLLSCPLAAVAAFSHPLPSSLISKFMDKMLFKASLNQRWKQPGDSSQQWTLSGCISLRTFWCREKKRTKVKGEAHEQQKSSAPYWVEENVISIFSYCQRQHWFLYLQFLCAFLNDSSAKFFLAPYRNEPTVMGIQHWPWTPAGASPPQNTHTKKEC